jgi:hypothetical protein
MTIRRPHLGPTPLIIAYSAGKTTESPNAASGRSTRLERMS